MRSSSSEIAVQVGSGAALLPLDGAVSVDSQQQFMEAVETIEWSSQSPSQMKQMIDRALLLGCYSVAADLATEGHSLYPNDPALRRIVRVLAPPKLISQDVPAIHGLSASVKWFEKHRQEYSGKWVAVRNGKLLASADSRGELSKELEQLDTRSDVLVAFAR